jgi:hypothetical protein
VDVRFGDFLRDMITADTDLVPDDPYGYRAALIDGFRSRGIRPSGAASYSEESLRWFSPEDAFGTKPPPCAGITFKIPDPPSAAELSQTASILSRYGTENAASLGLTPGLPVQAHKFHPLHRVGPNGQLELNMVVELVQQRQVPLDPADPHSPPFTYRGGASLLLDHDGEVRYCVYKRLGDDTPANDRLQQQRAYLGGIGTWSPSLTYSAAGSLDDLRVNLAAVHRGY